MKLTLKAIALSFAVASSASSVSGAPINMTLYFTINEQLNDVCISAIPTGTDCIASNGSAAKANHSVHTMRIKVLGAPADVESMFGFYIERPFFIVDGIHLSTEETRTLEQLQEDTEEFGIPAILQSLGYTPILVQFAETVRMSLKDNAKQFRDLLKFISASTVLPFPNKGEEGFVILGISQGGILGRYGAYLYDKDRSQSDAPVRLYASLDSPHQGAVMPRALMNTIGYWAVFGGSASAEAFRDLIRGPGARDLLIYQTNTIDHFASTSSDRFLFGQYRNAANYKGFPAVLVAQGQLKGKDPDHTTIYYNINRKARYAGAVVGRAASKIGYADNEYTDISHNSIYKMGERDNAMSFKGNSKYDFVQGSTYPFPQTMYESLRDGILDAIPHNMTTNKFGVNLTLSTSWDHNNLYQKSSTFIPTVSAMDLQCGGDLAIRKDCAHTQKADGINFENPGNISTANAVFAVDPTHPRYNEPISGRHIESPVKGGKIDQNVLAGMQTDVWRVLCEVAKYDYDATTEKFRNPKLNGVFSHKTSCMDQSKIPDIIKNAGAIKTRKIAYARYDFNSKASESDHTVPFTLPAGWQKVATFNIPDNIPAGSAFEIDISVKNPKSNWMKAELLMVRDARGNGQIQLTETDVPQYGIIHTLRWVLPNTGESVIAYKWLRLVLNSNGGDVVLYKPRIVTSSMEFAETPGPISSANIFPITTYKTVPWSDKVSLTKKLVGTYEWLYVSTEKRHDGFHFDLGKAVSMDKFASLVVEFEPGTCTHTEVYFDAKDTGSPNLGNYSLQNDIANKILPLSKIIKTDVTPNHSLSASRLKIQATADNETCNIKAIYLQ